MTEPIVGIDLGTTNSEVAFVRDGQPHVFAEDDDPILPSFVGLADDGRLLVGRAARNQWVLAPERTVKSIKRKMGQNVQVPLGDQKFTPQEISAMILRSLKDRASKQLGVPVRQAVITVPAFFNDTQRQATREAGELAGLEVVRILNEPTAASLCYDPNHQELRRILVYDLGGGTFDVSVVQSQDGVVEVLASHGDTALGGDDFDDALMDFVALKFKQQHGIDPRTKLATKARLLRAVEAAKRRLSDQPFVRIEEEFIAEADGVPLHLNLEISRQEFEDLIEPWLTRTIDCVQRSLNDAKVLPSQLDKVVLVGGSTRIPLVSSMLQNRVGQLPHCEVNPDLCVAMGAAIQAAMIAGQSVGAVLVDVTPHSLGIRCRTYEAGVPFGLPFEHKFAPIIRRNSPLPSNRAEVFSTVCDEQPSVDVEVFQGEHNDVRRNHHVGKFTIEGLAPVPAGNQIVVQLELNLDGMLKVNAREKATGLQKQITIENALRSVDSASQLDAQERLNRLWESNGTDDIPPEWSDEDGQEHDEGALETANVAAALPELAPAPREGQRESVQARALLEKGDRVRPKVSAEDQKELDRLMEAVRMQLTDRKWDALSKASNELSDVLFYLEDA